MLQTHKQNRELKFILEGIPDLSTVNEILAIWQISETDKVVKLLWKQKTPYITMFK